MKSLSRFTLPLLTWSLFALAACGGAVSSAGDEDMQSQALDASDIKFAFLPVGMTAPSGWNYSTGVEYDASRGWGWVREDSLGGTHVPLSLRGNGRHRSDEPESLLSSFLSMQLPQSSEGVHTHGAFDLKLPNGTYQVTVAVGDRDYLDSVHTVHVEGVAVIEGFVPSSSNRFQTATKTITVKDGLLTIDARGGTNTKLAYVHLQKQTDPQSPTPSPTDLFLKPFATTSPWNTRLPSTATFASDGDPRTLANTSGYINAANYSVPAYAAQASDAWVTVQGPPANTTLQIPANVKAAGGTDATLAIVNPVHTVVDEFWQARPQSNGGWTTNWHGHTSLEGSGFGTGIRASQFSVLGGLIREWEVKAASIDHALVISIPANRAKKGWVWPATYEDGYADQYSGTIPLGSLFAIPPSVDVTKLGLTSSGVVLAKALQRYGVYVGDTGTPGGSSNFGFVADPSLEGSAQLADMRHDVSTLRKYLRVVTNNQKH